jgi:hypothetical protein
MEIMAIRIKNLYMAKTMPKALCCNSLVKYVLPCVEVREKRFGEFKLLRNHIIHSDHSENHAPESNQDLFLHILFL